MELFALVKRIIAFLAGLTIGIVPSWIFVPISEVAVVSPVVFEGTFACSPERGKNYHGERSSVDESKLQIVSKPRPGYTESARSESTEGTVVLRVVFLASGRIGAVTPIKSLPNGLTEAAIGAAKEIEFEPARENGRRVSVTKQVEYTFSLY